MSIKTIVGRLGGVPEVKVTNSGRRVASFAVAETKRRFNRDTNQWEDAWTIWHDCEAWQNADALTALSKGAQVIVLGEEKDASYDSRETGKKVRRVVVNVQTVGTVLRDGQGATGGANSAFGYPGEGGEVLGAQWAAQQPPQDTWAPPVPDETPF